MSAFLGRLPSPDETSTGCLPSVDVCRPSLAGRSSGAKTAQDAIIPVLLLWRADSLHSVALVALAIEPAEPRASALPQRCRYRLDQFSTFNPGTAARSVSMDTTVQLLRANAMAAIMMSICCMGRPMRRSSANMRPNCAAASFE